MSDKNDRTDNNDLSSGESDLSKTILDNVSNANIPDEVQNEIKENRDEISNPTIDPELVDSDGIVFDPEIHATDKGGDPSRTKTGKFRKKKGVSNIAAKDAKKFDEKVKEIGNIKATSTVASAVFIQTGVVLFGDEWNPKTEPYNEREMLDNAFFEYFKEKEIKDIPAGVALVMALGSYALPRFTQPKTQSRVATLKEKIAGKIYTMKNRPKKAKQNATHVSNREERERKNDTTSTPSKEQQK